VLLGLSLIAAGWRVLPNWIRLVYLFGLMSGFCLGIVLHFYIQSLRANLIFGAEGVVMMLPGEHGLLGAALYNNAILRMRYALPFLGDRIGFERHLLLIPLSIIAVGGVAALEAPWWKVAGRLRGKRGAHMHPQP